MSTRVVERVDEWDEQSFGGGYRGLQDLADADFSGVVRAAGAELYMTKGTVVGIERGTIEDFEGEDGTAYRAPSPALPLLAVMQQRSDEVRAKYYTEDTPISEVDATLSDGGFTGYVELSENVLSGDYYQVYHRGRSMSVAFVGNSEQLIDGDEAFETADDEVGIYEVRPVDIEAIEIPEPSDPETTADAAGAGAGGDREDDEEEPGAGATVGTGVAAGGGEDIDAVPGTDAETGEGAEPTPGGETEPARSGANEGGADADVSTAAESSVDSGPAEEQPSGEPGVDEGRETGTGTGESEASTDATSTQRAETTGDETGDTTPPGEGVGDGAETEPSGETGGSGPRPGAETGRDPEAERSGESPGRERDREERATGDVADAASRNETERAETAEARRADDAGRSESSGGGQPTAGRSRQRSAAGGATSATLETRAIPSLDPARTSTSESAEQGAGADAGPRVGPDYPDVGGESGSRAPSPGTDAETEPEPTPDREPGAESGSSPEVDREPGAEPGDTGESAERPGSEEEPEPDRVSELREQVEERDAEIERLEGELDEAVERREELEAELAEVREERDELAAEVEELEEELERVEEEFGAATGADRRLTASEALDGTDLFVRYRSKNDPTLAAAHDGGERKEAVTENLRLEQHTQFDASEVAVNGQEYASFIEDRVEYQFVKWVVEDLLFEVRDTGRTDGLADLYDALPDVDRAELNGTVAVSYTEDGQEQRGQETFDIVLRDRMGNPLFVANLNDSREGATEGMMETLITAAERVGSSKDTLAGAFLVTESFFEPEALETASEATKGGLLSRDKRESFVNLSRKRGYHLCLVEARNQNFHLAVPEL